MYRILKGIYNDTYIPYVHRLHWFTKMAKIFDVRTCEPNLKCDVANILACCRSVPIAAIAEIRQDRRDRRIDGSSARTASPRPFRGCLFTVLTLSCNFNSLTLTILLC